MAGKPPREEKPGAPAPAPKRAGPTGESDFEATSPGRPRSPTVSEVMRLTGQSARSLPKVGVPPAKPAAPPPKPSKGLPDLEKTGPVLVPRPVLQKQLQASGFDDDERTQVEAALGHAKDLELDEDEEDSNATVALYDGLTPAPEVTAPEAWKAVTAPVQNKPGRRSAEGYAVVLDQFAVGHNPRYQPDAPGRERGHIFVWDVTRAMGCEVPHFAGGREMSLLQTVDWLRREAPVRGWKKCDPARAAAFADQGLPVLAAPKDPKARQLAVVRPGGLGADGLPRVAAAAVGRGNELSTSEALGTPLAEFFVHD